MSKPFKVERFTKTHEHWDPDDPSRFVVQGHAEIICVGAPGGEAVALTVMSPAQLATELEPGGVELGRGFIFMHDYDERAVIRTLQKLVDGANANDWRTLQRALERYFDWLE